MIETNKILNGEQTDYFCEMIYEMFHILNCGFEIIVAYLIIFPRNIGSTFIWSCHYLFE